MKNSVAAMFLLVVINLSLAQTTGKQFNVDGSGVAIDGYDPVSYFISQKPVKGKKEFSLLEHGIIYQFASQKNENMFRSDPAKYEPQYGGWCAYAMGFSGNKVEVDPETFKILNGKLYLFYNKFFNNTLKSWNKNEANLKNKADANWLKIIHQ